MYGFQMRAHEEDINAVRFGTYGDDVILSGSDDGLIKVIFELIKIYI